MNDEGAEVSMGSAARFFCGRTLGQAELVPGSIGVCGPRAGPQCPACARLQRSNAVWMGAPPPSEFSFAILLPKLCALKSLAFEACDLSESKFLACLASTLPLCTALESLVFGETKLAEADLPALIEVLPACEKLMKFALYDSADLDDGGAVQLATVLPRTAIEHLDLSSSQMSENAVQSLLNTVSESTKLKHCDLSDNRVPFERVLPTLRALPPSRVLALDISNAQSECPRHVLTELQAYSESPDNELNIALTIDDY